jgi:predicted nucleic acid-binding protein
MDVMMIFMDTSAWVKYFIEEDGTEEIQKFILNESDTKTNVFSASAVTYAEMLATLGYRLKAGQFSLLWLYSSRAYPRIVESIILSR